MILNATEFKNTKLFKQHYTLILENTRTLYAECNEAMITDIKECKNVNFFISDDKNIVDNCIIVINK